MTILNQWVKELNYQNQKVNGLSYLCNDEEYFLIPVKSLILGFDFPRKINNSKYVEGMEKLRAKSILKGIFNEKYIEAIEVYLEYSYINNYHYKLANGYHRYTISRHLNFSHIPVKVVENLNHYFHN